jgi:hypothetical protein
MCQKYYCQTKAIFIYQAMTLTQDSVLWNGLELVPIVMIDDLDKSCAKAEPNFDK